MAVIGRRVVNRKCRDASYETVCESGSHSRGVETVAVRDRQRSSWSSRWLNVRSGRSVVKEDRSSSENIPNITYLRTVTGEAVNKEPIILKIGFLFL